MGLRKEKEKEDAILAWQNTEHALYIGSPMPVTLDLLGSHFELGPSTMYCGRAVMCDSEESYQKYVAACEGGAVSLKFKPLAPVEQIFHKFQPEPGTDQSRGQADAPVT